MARRTYKRLTAATIKAVATVPGMYPDGDGLYLAVTKAGVASWGFRYSMGGGREHWMGLGPLRHVSLGEARKLADEARRQKGSGIDPLAARRAQRLSRAEEAAKAISFEDCARAYISAHQAGWKNPVHRKQWPSTLERYVYPVFGKVRVQAVDVGMVMQSLEPIWTVKPETAGRVRGRIESVLDWAAARDYRQGDNPARWRGHLENLLPKRSKLSPVQHHPAIAHAELGAFLIDLRRQDGIASRALEFAILTAARTGEVIGATWDEINISERLWTIPAVRMKSGLAHRVPLSKAALKIIESMKAVRVGDWVFPGTTVAQPLSNMSLLKLLSRMGRGDLTVHGFRSTFRNWCAECTNFPHEVAEMALSHAVGDKVEAAYRRGDLLEKREQLAEAWARFCAAPAMAGDVVPLRGTR